MMTADGTEDLETQKSDIDIGRRALGIQKEVMPQEVFDFRFVREVYKELRETGTRPGVEAEQVGEGGKG